MEIKSWNVSIGRSADTEHIWKQSKFGFFNLAVKHEPDKYVNEIADSLKAR